MQWFHVTSASVRFVVRQHAHVYVPPQLSGCEPQLPPPDGHAVAAVSGVQPHSPAVPPPPHVSYWFGQVQLMIPPQLSEMLPHSWLPSLAVAALQSRGAQHCEVALTHSWPEGQVQSRVPPQPSLSVAQTLGYLVAQVQGVQQAPPLQMSPGLQPQVMLPPQLSETTPQLPGVTVPHTAGVQHWLLSGSQTWPLLHEQVMAPPWPLESTPHWPG